MFGKQEALGNIHFHWHFTLLIKLGLPVKCALSTFVIAYSMSNLVKSLGRRITLPRFDTWL